MEAYLAHLAQERRLSPLTVANYERDLRAFQTFRTDQGIASWEAVTAQHVRAFIAAGHRSGLSGRSLQRRLSSLRGFFNYLMREERVAGNPAQAVRAPKTPRRLPHTLDADQTGQLLNEAPQDALEAGFEIDAAVQAFNRDGGVLAPPRPVFDVGIGISTGSVLVGTIGGDQHFASSVFGEAVVEAPKIEKWTRSSGARLLISAPTRDGLDGAAPYTFREVGQVAGRGDQSPEDEDVAVFAVERS